MPKKITKTFKEIANILVGKSSQYTKEQMLEILSQFADEVTVSAIVNRHNKMTLPMFESPSDCWIKRMAAFRTQDTGEKQYTKDLHKVHLEACFWVNDLDDPYASDHYRGWMYVFRFVNGEYPGHYIMKEPSVLLKPIDSFGGWDSDLGIYPSNTHE